MRSWRLAYLNLTRRKVPTAIAFLAIGISVGCSGIIYRLDRLSEERFSHLAHGGDAVVGAKSGSIDILLGSLQLEGDYPGYLPEKLFQSLRQRVPVHFEDGTETRSNSIRSIIPLIFFGKYKDHRVIGTDETFLRRPISEDNLEFAQGRWAAREGEVVLGALVSEAEGLGIGDLVPAQVWTGGEPGAPLPLHVVGIFRPKDTAWDRALYATLPQAKAVLSREMAAAATKSPEKNQSIWNADVLHYFLIYLEPGAFVPLQSLINQRTVGQIIRVSDAKEKLEELTGSGRRLGIFISSLILFLSGLSVAAMMITRFDGMSIQLAVLRAMGYSRMQVASWLLCEGLLLGAFSCVLGATLDALAFSWIRELLGSAFPDPSVLSISIFQSSPIWLISILATLSTVGFPLIRLSRQNIHQSMKGM